MKSWKRFYRENEGRLPVECQAGRAALGMETQDSLLEAENISDIKVGPYSNGPLREPEEAVSSANHWYRSSSESAGGNHFTRILFYYSFFPGAGH